MTHLEIAEIARDRNVIARDGESKEPLSSLSSVGSRDTPAERIFHPRRLLGPCYLLRPPPLRRPPPLLRDPRDCVRAWPDCREAAELLRPSRVLCETAGVDPLLRA